MVLKLYVLFHRNPRLFENDVKMYGTQTHIPSPLREYSLRMM